MTSKIHRYRLGLQRLGCGVLCICVCVGYRLHSLASAPAYQRPETSRVWVDGYITSFPQQTDQSWHALFDVDHVNAVAQKLRMDLQLWRPPKPQPQLGEHWRFYVALHALGNKSKLNSQTRYRWYAAQGVQLRGAAEGNTALHLPSAAGWAMLPWRNKISQAILSSLKASPMAGIIAALVVGDKSAISQPQWRILKATGTSHLVAISGLHIGLVATACWWLGKQLSRFSRAVCLRWTVPLVARYAGVLGALCYGALAGMSASTLRAGLMVSLMALATACKRLRHIGHHWLASMILVSLCQPRMLYSTSFWLSYGAVALLCFTCVGRLAVMSRLRGVGAAQAAISVGMLPLNLGFFDAVPVVAPLTNLFAIPWFSIGVVPLALGGLVLWCIRPQLGGYLWHAASMIAGWLWYWLAWIGQSISLWQPSRTLVGLELAMLAVCGLMLLAPRTWPCRHLGWFGCLPLLWPGVEHVTVPYVDLIAWYPKGRANYIIHTPQQTCVLIAERRTTQVMRAWRFAVNPLLRRYDKSARYPCILPQRKGLMSHSSEGKAGFSWRVLAPARKGEQGLVKKISLNSGAFGFNFL